MSEAEALLAEIGRLYAALQALPSGERSHGRPENVSARYRALEAEIRDRVARYMAIDPQRVLIAQQV